MAWRFETPGFVDHDLPEAMRTKWHDWHATRATQNLRTMLDMLGTNDPSRVPYVNPASDPLPEDRSTVSVDWDGFPAFVEARFGRGVEAEIAADDKGYEDFGLLAQGARREVRDASGKIVDCRARHRQDEYLEWEAVEDQGRLRSVTFVAEGYDYWAFLFEHAPERVRDAYRVRTGNPAIEVADLRAPSDLTLWEISANGDETIVETIAVAGKYNPRNQLNQGPGIVHLSHRANSLSAEVNLAVTSALPRHDASRVLVDASDPRRLLCCTQGGNPNRSSDPRIAAAAYGEVTKPGEPTRFTLTNPVGLYIREYDANRALQDPKLKPVERDRFWTAERGVKPKDPDHPFDSRILRLHVEVPASEDYLLGEMFVDGMPLRRPAQLAKLIKMHLMVDTWPTREVTESLRCSGSCCVDGDILLPYKPPTDCEDFGLEDNYPELLSPLNHPVGLSGSIRGRGL